MNKLIAFYPYEECLRYLVVCSPANEKAAVLQIDNRFWLGKILLACLKTDSNVQGGISGIVRFNVGIFRKEYNIKIVLKMFYDSIKGEQSSVPGAKGFYRFCKQTGSSSVIPQQAFSVQKYWLWIVCVCVCVCSWSLWIKSRERPSVTISARLSPVPYPVVNHAPLFISQ